MEHHHKLKSTAKRHAERKRKMGFLASVYPRKEGWGVSVTRK